MKKKVSFFIGSMHGGGAEKVISILANYYKRKGWDVDIALLLDTNVGYLLDEGIQIVDLSQTKGSYYRRLPKWLNNVREYVKKIRPDCIVSFVGRINALVLMACVGINVPIVVSERNDPKHDGRSFVEFRICNWLYYKANAVVFQTQYERCCFSSKLKNAVIIGNPVSVKVTSLKVERPFEILTAGRLSPQKNQKMLIDAIAMLDEPSVKLKIYGDGNLKDSLQRRINELGLENKVELCGNVSDLHERMNGAGIFVLCSEFEGLSNALIEAMMLGLVCISTDYPGSDELITDGENGLLVPCGDTNKLAEAINKVFINDKLRAKLVQGALNTSKKYKEEKVLIQWEKVIEGL